MNILFLFPDQHRGDWLPYDNTTAAGFNFPQIPIRMDNLRGIMDHGTAFPRAITNSPLCVPARACLASGMDYRRCGVYNNDFCYPLERKTFYEVLREQGYNVGAAGKLDLHKPIMYWSPTGWIDQLSRLGFTHCIDSEGKYDLLWSSFYEPRGPYSQYLHENDLMRKHAKDYIRRYYNVNDAEPTLLPDHAYSDNWVAANALKILGEMRQENKPWFLQVNFPGPHNPWDVTVSMKERWKNVKFPIPEDYTGDVYELLEVRRNYAAMLENIDRNIGLILDDLRKAGELDNTLIVYASDHGEMLGNRNLYFKKFPWQPSLYIPMVISGPGIPRGVISGELAQLHDLAATFAEYAGGKLPAGRDAISLLPLLKGEKETLRGYQLAGLYNTAQHQGEYPGYEEYTSYKKQGTDSEYIDSFNNEFHITPTRNSAKKYDFYGQWDCVVTKTHKLIRYDSGELELYDLIVDPMELEDISPAQPVLVKQLLECMQVEEIVLSGES